MAKSYEDLSSKRHFHWTTKVTNEEEEEEEAPTLIKPSKNTSEDKKKDKTRKKVPNPEPVVSSSSSSSSSSSQRRKLQAIAVSRLRSVLTTAFRRSWSYSSPLGLGQKVIGTLFGHRRGHVNFAFQKDPASEPSFLIEMTTPISVLVKEMASGLVRIVLECDKEEGGEKKTAAAGPSRLLEEPLWRSYCNGKKCGFATRLECGVKEWKVLKAVEPISMGAGVLPGSKKGEDGGGGEGDGDGDGGEKEEVMYMRAKFERVVGSRDSEAFYMMNPDSNGTPELSVYLLRV